MEYDGECVIYRRISSDPEGTEIGVVRQEADCRELAARHKLRVVKVYEDNDRGASNLSKKPRPGYADMLEEVRNGNIKNVLSYSNSRLTRRPAEWIELINLANSGKLQIRTVVSGSHDLTTADGRAVAITVAAWDAAEAERIGERLKAAHKHMARSGEPFTGGRRPFGWKEDRKSLEPREAQLIREGYQKVLAGLPINTLAKEWNQAGVRTPWEGVELANGTVATGEWTFSNLREVLTRPRVSGLRTLRGEIATNADGTPVRGRWTPIVSEPERQHLLRVLEERARPRRRKGSYLLGSLLVCGKCGSKMWGNVQGAREAQSYQCAKGGHLAISGRRLEEFIGLVVAQRLARLELYWRDHEQPGRVAQPYPRLEELLDAEERSAQLMRDYLAHPNLGSLLLPEVEALQELIGDLSKERKQWELLQVEQAEREPTPLYAFYAKSNEGEVRAKIESLVQHIVIRPTEKGTNGPGVVESRVAIVWKPEAAPWAEGEAPRLWFEETEGIAADPDGAVEWSARAIAKNEMGLRPWKHSDADPAVLQLLRQNPQATTTDVMAATGLAKSTAQKVRQKIRIALLADPSFELAPRPPEPVKKDWTPDKTRAPHSIWVSEVERVVAEHPEWSGRRIGRELGISHTFAYTVLKELKWRQEHPEEEVQEVWVRKPVEDGTYEAGS